jgi:hypothetical protein
MKDSKTLLEQTRQQLAASSPNTPTAAGQPGFKPAADTSAIIDAINQVFAEFELVYHNQYLKAFPTLEKLQYGKQLWFSHLKDYSAAQIIAAAHRAIKESEYLPTIAGLVKYCENEWALYGLPDPRTAYIEACQKPSPKAEQAWSHPAVYHAGCAADWFFLANNTEAKALPVFEQHYRQIADRVRQGDILEIPVIPALPESLPSQLSHEEQLQRIQALREQLQKL